MDDSVTSAIRQLIQEEVARSRERSPEPPKTPRVLVVSTEVLPGGRLLPITEVARQLGMFGDWVYDRINAGELATVSLGSTKAKRRIEAAARAGFERAIAD